MANSITLTKTFYSTKEAQAFINLPIKTFILASDWLSVEVDHVLVTIDRNGSVEVWLAVLGEGLGLDAVPSSVVLSVSQAINNIVKNNDRVQELRSFDFKMKSDGRYEADLWVAGVSFPQDVAVVAQFVTDALGQGIDAMGILRSMGFVCGESPSPQAIGWL